MWLLDWLASQPGVKTNIDNLVSGQEIMKDIDSSGDKKILYVEDNPANMKLMVSVLSRMENIELFTAAEAEKGIEIAKNEIVDLILMDTNLPGMNGVEAMKILRDNDETSHIPVIAVTANAMKSDIEEGQKAGFKDYLTKPLDIHRTIALINEYLVR
jgi:protein-histidine pros-kinase